MAGWGELHVGWGVLVGRVGLGCCGDGSSWWRDQPRVSTEQSLISGTFLLFPSLEDQGLTALTLICVRLDQLCLLWGSTSRRLSSTDTALPSLKAEDRGCPSTIVEMALILTLLYNRLKAYTA